MQHVKIRINDLARELEVKSKEILDALLEVGIKEKKTHSSSIEDHEADLVRKHFTAQTTSAGSRDKAASPAEMKPKIDFSKVHKPGDVARQLREREEQVQRPVAPPPASVRPVTTTVMPPVVAPKAQPKISSPIQPPVQEKPAAVVAKPPAPPAPPVPPVVEKAAVVSPPPHKPAAPVVPVAPTKPAAPPAVIVTPPTQPPPVVAAPPA